MTARWKRAFQESTNYTFMFIAIMPSSNTFLLLLTGLYPKGQPGMHPMRDRSWKKYNRTHI